MKTIIAITCAAAPLLLFEGSIAHGQQPAAGAARFASGATVAVPQAASANTDPSSQEQFERAEKKYAEAQSAYNGFTWTTGPEHVSGGAGGSLVVLSSERDPKSQSGLEEDLAVMSHILDKAVQQKLGSDHRFRTAMGINVLFAPGSSSFRTLYLEDYGALFTLRVGFPLLPPPTDEQAGKEKTPVDSTWDEARQELYGHHPQPRFAASSVEPFSQEKVDALKEALIEALKNASHIQGLKQEEYVTLCVFGGASGRYAVGKASTSQVVVLGDVTSANGLMSGQGSSPRRSTVLTIRAKKADVDAFAKGELTADQFRKRIGMSTYVGAAQHGGGDTTYTISGASGFGGSGSYGGGVGFGPSDPFFRSEGGAERP